MSLRNVLGSAIPIAAGYFGGPAMAGMMGGQTAGAVAAGALAGGGIAALSGDDVLMGAVGGGLGGYGGGGLRGAADATKLAQAGVGGGTNAGVNTLSNQFVSPYTPAGGFGAQQANSALTGINTGTSAFVPNEALAMNKSLNSQNTFMGAQDINPAIKSGQVPNMGKVNPGRNIGGGGYRSFGDSVTAAGDSISGGVDSAKAAFNDTDTFFSELGDGDTTAGYMKAGLTALPVGVAALTPEYEGDSYNDNPMNRYDPNRRLNLSNDTGISEALKKDSGLRLIAQGGMIKGYAEGGNVGILNRPSLNLNNQQALNLNTGSNIPAPVANPTITSTPGQNVGGSSNQPFSVPTRKEYGTGGPNVVPGDYIGGLGTNYSQDIAGNFRRIAQGGAIKGYAKGGYLDGGNVGDGMSDDIPATINGNQPAALADGEFVVPADVVSHLGNGSSNAGSRRLYEMMDEVRKARTGREKQGKEINAERYMPA